MIGLPPCFWHQHGIGGGVIQSSASDCVLVSLLAARHRTIKQLKERYCFPLKDFEDALILSKLVAYCSKLVRSIDVIVMMTSSRANA